MKKLLKYKWYFMNHQLSYERGLQTPHTHNIHCLKYYTYINEKDTGKDLLLSLIDHISQHQVEMGGNHI